MLTVTVKQSDEMPILHCEGRIVSGDETAILCAAMAQEKTRVALDLADVTAIDAAGIGVFVALQAAGIYVQLRNPNQIVREALNLTHVDSLIEVVDGWYPEQTMMGVAAACP